jgi:hypothetical protein
VRVRPAIAKARVKASGPIQCCGNSLRGPESHERLVAFRDQWVYPNDVLHSAQVQADRWRPPPIVEELKVRAKMDQSAMEFRRNADDYDRSLRGTCLLHDRLGAGR